VPARQTVFARSPADGLRAVAEDGAVRALVLGSSHRGPIGRVLPGGVGRRLLATSTCPIIVAPVGFASRRPAKIDHIGCGFDGSPESRAAWVEACRVADVARAALHVYAIRETHAFVMATGPMIGSDPAGLDQAATEVLQRELMELVNAAPDHLFIEPIMRSGDPATVLREVAHELDLLVVGSRQMSRFGAMLLGSVSAKLMASADCPVMVVPGSLRTPDELR
jgi:nucleotide-binding universal stress UspA family protein